MGSQDMSELRSREGSFKEFLDERLAWSGHEA